MLCAREDHVHEWPLMLDLSQHIVVLSGIGELTGSNLTGVRHSYTHLSLWFGVVEKSEDRELAVVGFRTSVESPSAKV